MEKSIKYYDRAINANPNDPLLLTESDKIYEQANIPTDQRLKRLESHLKTVMKHDDAVMRLLTLYKNTEYQTFSFMGRRRTSTRYLRRFTYIERDAISEKKTVQRSDPRI